MRTWLISLALAALTFTAVARADEHEELRAAMHELKIAQRHLKAAPASYEGHRLAALNAVKTALQEIRLALAPIRKEKAERQRGGGGDAPAGEDAAGDDD